MGSVTTPAGTIPGVARACNLLGLALWSNPLGTAVEGAAGQRVLLEAAFAGLDHAGLRAALEGLLNEAASLAVDGDALKAAERDRIRLLLGVPKPVAPPWESVWRSEDHRVQQEPAAEVFRRYLAARLGFDGMQGEPPDHAGLELLFVAGLLDRGDVAEARTFFRDHPATFLEPFGEAIEREAVSSWMRWTGSGLCALARAVW